MLSKNQPPQNPQIRITIAETNPKSNGSIQKETKMLHFKGYLHYKTITSQDVSSDTQVKNFFIL